MLALSAALGACSGGSDQVPVTSTPATATRVVTGQVTKGPLSGAQIDVRAIDSRGQAGAMLAQTTTDAGGNWSVTIAGGNAPLLVVSSGGRYVDEADPEPDPADRRSVLLGPDDRLRALLPPGAASVAVNLYTDALLRKSLALGFGE